MSSNSELKQQRARTEGEEQQEEAYVLQYQCPCTFTVGAEDIFVCRACSVLACRGCAHKRIVCLYCPSCLSTVTRAAAASDLSRCVQCIRCPSCTAVLNPVKLTAVTSQTTSTTFSLQCAQCTYKLPYDGESINSVLKTVRHKFKTSRDSQHFSLAARWHARLAQGRPDPSVRSERPLSSSVLLEKKLDSDAHEVLPDAQPIEYLTRIAYNCQVCTAAFVTPTKNARAGSFEVSVSKNHALALNVLPQLCITDVELGHHVKVAIVNTTQAWFHLTLRQVSGISELSDTHTTDDDQQPVGCTLAPQKKQLKQQVQQQDQIASSRALLTVLLTGQDEIQQQQRLPLLLEVVLTCPETQNSTLFESIFGVSSFAYRLALSSSSTQEV